MRFVIVITPEIIHKILDGKEHIEKVVSQLSGTELFSIVLAPSSSFPVPSVVPVASNKQSDT